MRSFLEGIDYLEKLILARRHSRVSNGVKPAEANIRLWVIQEAISLLKEYPGRALLCQQDRSKAIYGSLDSMDQSLKDFMSIGCPNDSRTQILACQGGLYDL